MFTHEMAEILVECRLREMLIEDAINHPFRDIYAEQDWGIESTYGPSYSPARWFGAGSGAEGMRYSRALQSLVKLGLVQRCVDSHSGRVLNISLTPEGVEAADKIGG